METFLNWFPLDLPLIAQNFDRFLVGVRVLTGTVSAGQAGQAYATLAEVMVRRLFEAVADEFARVHGRVQGGEAATSQLLAAAPKIDAVWNHDDDQGIGVLAAIQAANRSDFFMVGGAGSKNAMESIKAGDSVLRATVIYPSTQAADGIALARLIALGEPASDLVTKGVPNRIVLNAPVVTKDNVDKYIGAAFAS